MLPVRVEPAVENNVFHDPGNTEEAAEIGKLALLRPLRRRLRRNTEESDLWEYFEKHGYRRISFQFVLHEAEAFAHLADPLDETAGRRTPHLARRREDVLRAFDSD